ncbi:MAG TPA: CTP synthase [Patescibacteria group bacterium]|nr:CTP synthase [Patescibacteria group bacterium]
MPKTSGPKFIIVSGGVISGLGKGITTASIALLLKSRGYRVSPIKCDMYLNIDAGTMNPTEHGEVFVTDDGLETDQDLGHYERFTDIPLSRVNYTTAGQVYSTVIAKERNFAYGGKCVEAFYDVTEEIISRIKAAAEGAEVVIVELGGTAGEHQNVLYFEAARRMKLKYRDRVVHVHVGYLPVPGSIGEMKSKPLQQSIQNLNALGIQPDFIIGRSEKSIDRKRKEKIALFANLEPEDIFANPDVESIYEVPLVLEGQGLTDSLIDRLELPKSKRDLLEWRKLVERIKVITKPLKIALVGKYFGTGDFTLEDSYVSVIEALKHAAWAVGRKPELYWVDAEKIEREGPEKLAPMDGIVVPGGFGDRGIEGMVRSAQFARESGKPYLGLCYGMQMMTVDFARHVAGLEGAGTTEADPKAKHPVIHIMPDQEKKLLKLDYGGSMRLGAYEMALKPGSIAQRSYGKPSVSERHRHRYEFNSDYRRVLEKAGLVVSATSQGGKLVEMIEITGHPFMVGTQAHPEFKSRPLKPHPLFVSFAKAAAREQSVPSLPKFQAIYSD